MARDIPATEMNLFIHCQDDEGNHGVCFLRDTKTNKQFGDSYIDTFHLYNGHEVKFCKSHGIKIILPQDQRKVAINDKKTI